MTRTLGATVLAVSLVAAAASADTPNENARTSDEREGGDATQATRTLQPTPSELEAFELPRPALEEGMSGGGGGSAIAFEASGFAMFAASAADVATTEWGLSRGLSEGNPMASSRTARLLHHVVGPAAVWYTTEKLQKSGKKKLALTLRIALMAAYGYAALHNTRQIAGIGPQTP